MGRSITGILSGSGAAAQTQMRDQSQQSDVFVERDRTGQPHKGKVLAAIQPHSDDLPLFAAGTVIKLIREGYRGIMIRTTNDEMAGAGRTVAEVVLNNENDNFDVARRMGLFKVFDLNSRNHRMDEVSRIELVGRLIFIFRLMKVDTVLCYDPWGHYEENTTTSRRPVSRRRAGWLAGAGTIRSILKPG
jgi:hypothetical protein